MAANEGMQAMSAFFIPTPVSGLINQSINLVVFSEGD